MHDPRHSGGRCRPNPGVLLALALIAPACALEPSEAKRFIATGVVPAEWPVEASAPVSVPCAPGDRFPEKPQVSLATGGAAKPGGRPLLAQFEPADEADGTSDRLWIMPRLDNTVRGQPVSVRLSGDSSPAAKNCYRTQRDGEQLVITTPDGKSILSYWYGRPARAGRYPLTDFIHPLMGLDGETLTDFAPKDHPHHRGIFWSWVRHEQDGKSLGTWWIPTGIHVDARDLVFTDGPVFSRFQARHQWIYEPKGATEGMPFVDEQVTCRVFGTTPIGRALDIDLTLTALVDGIRIGGTTELNKGYGGLTFRYAPAAASQVVADSKPILKDLNHLRARWADWSGRFKLAGGQAADRRSGAAILVAPDHPDSPPEWITRLYGVLNVSYPGLRMIDLPKGQPLRLHYRIWIHRGDAQEGRVDDQYRAYAADWKWTVIPGAKGKQGDRATIRAPHR